MGFLDWLADWCERNIPAIGWAIAYVVRSIQWGVESAYGWIKNWVEWLKDTFYPWVLNSFDAVWDSVDYLKRRIWNYIEPTINSLELGLSKLETWYDWVKREINSFVSDPFGYIESHLPSWIKDWLRDLQIAFDNFKSWVSCEIPKLWSWIQNAPNWFIHQLDQAKQRIWSYVEPYVKPVINGWNWFTGQFNEFLKDPIGYIKKAVNPLIKQIYDFFKPITDNLSKSLENAWKTITSLDQAIRYGFTSFLMGMLGWFLNSFFKDLSELEYDPETGEVYGTPENPFTYVVIALMKVEKPKPPLGE